MFPPGVSAAVNICLTCLWSHVCRTYPHAGRTRPHACRTYPHLQVTNMYIEVLHWIRSRYPYWWVGGWVGVEWGVGCVCVCEWVAASCLWGGLAWCSCVVQGARDSHTPSCCRVPCACAAAHAQGPQGGAGPHPVPNP